jgi:hypothetical protein
MPDDGAVIADGTLTGNRKTDFSHIYVQPDPRQYFRVLNALEYQVAQRALPVFNAVLAASRRAGRNRTVLDLCCSYGINSVLLSRPADLDHVADRYARPDIDALSPGELAEADSRYYAGRRGDLTVLGLDSSGPAIGYATRAGLLDAGWAEDLETDEPSPALAAGIAGTGLIISTGGVGYVGYRTFERLLKSIHKPEELWLAIFVLRVFDYSEIAAVLARYGLVTECLEGTFRQRRFADDDERKAAIHDVELRGLDPAGKEADGWYHANCYLTRPAAAAARTPAAWLLTSQEPLRP